MQAIAIAKVKTSDILAKAALGSGLILGVLLLLFIFITWQKPIIPENNEIQVELEGIDPPLREVIDVAAARNAGGGVENPSIKGTPGPSGGERSNEPNTRNVLDDPNGETSMPTRGNSNRGDLPKDNNPKPPGSPNPNPKYQFGGLNNGQNGDGGNNGNVNTGYNRGTGGGSGSGNGNGSGNGRGIIGVKQLNISGNYEDDIVESGKAFYLVTFDRSGRTISANFESKNSNIRNKRQIEIGKEKVQKITIGPSSDEYRTFKIEVKFEKEGQ
jgi:hypothetical protein